MAAVSQKLLIQQYRAGEITLDDILEGSKQKNKYGCHTTKAQIYWKAYCRIKSGDYYSPWPYLGKSGFSKMTVKFEKPIGGDIHEKNT